MPSTSPGPGRYAVIALATVAARWPFLLRGDRFFDADAAVEGLMARHLGDHSLFLWGQRYKGTPEVLLTGAVFHVAGSGVLALHAVTLACFVVFLCLNFRLLERECAGGIAWTATAFFIAGPPSLVLWSLSGSAEIVMTFLAGSVLLLALGAWRRAPVAAFALGAGLWVQQYILYYIVSLAAVAALGVRDWRGAARTFRARTPAWVRGGMALLLAIAGLYAALGLMAFFTSGLDLRIGGVRITATHPQKMWWIAGALTGATAAAGGVAMLRRRLIAPALAFLAGYSPAIIGRIGNHGLGAPISRLDVHGLRAALPGITGVMLPILAGWRDPLGHPTILPVFALAPLAAIAASYWCAWRRTLNPVFHLFPIVAGGMFLLSGSYIDAQSYRYLMPIYAALPIVYAVGIDGVWRASRIAGAALLVTVLLVFTAQQVSWYRQLEPDRASARTIACLDAAGVAAARAPYWRSYTVTFLTHERLIVSPIDGIDRYAPYDERTRHSPTLEQLGCQ